MQIERHFFALNSETYILIRQQVKHKSKYSCKSAIYFDLSLDIIKENCKFIFYFNKTDITPTALDRGNEIILANWPDDKHVICNVNNDISVKIPSHPYVLVNIGVLGNCRIEAKNNCLLESLAACHDANSKLMMYFTVSTAFVNYLDSLDNLTDSLKFPLLVNRTTFEQILPISLNLSSFDSELLTLARTLKVFVHQFHHKKEIFNLRERHTNMELELPNKKLFFNNYTLDIFLFVTDIILLLVKTIVMYTLCKHMKLKTLVTSLALQQIKEIGVVTKQEGITLVPNIKCTYKT